MRYRSIARSFLLVVGFIMTLMLVLPISQAEQNSTSGKSRVQFTLSPLQSMSIGSVSENLSGSSTTLDTSLNRPQSSVSELDLALGFMERLDAENLTLTSNISWVVKVRTEDLSMGKSFDGTYTMPVEQFQLRRSGVGENYFSITRFDQMLVNGAAGIHEVNIDYRVLLDRVRYQDGDYRILLIYTITSE